jgi:prepilin-type N-terminal cleavage/methylation domain-containing protein
MNLEPRTSNLERGQAPAMPEPVPLTERGQSPEAGFTFAELVIALALIGLVAMLVLPRLSVGTNSLSAASRQLSGTIRTLFTTASATKRLYRLYLDLDQQSYWTMVVLPEGERSPMASGLAQRIVLPSDIRLLDVVTPAQGKVSTTRATIQFTPGGRTERSTVHLADGDGNVLTLLLNPITGEVRVLDRYAEFPAPQPLPDAIKMAFFPGGDVK